MDRFWSKVDQSGGPDACWPWLGFRFNGYGKFWFDGRSRAAHRIAYELAVAPVDHGHLHHTCGKRECCNPTHLVSMTKSEHMRHHQEAKTHCKYGHPLEFYAPWGQRMCHVCRRRRQREDQQRQRAARKG